MPRQPRIRMFAGPNGSGKSTVKEYLLPHHIGAYLNADELEQQLNQTHTVDLNHYHSALQAQDLIDFLKKKKRPKAGEYTALLAKEPILLDHSKILFDASEIDSYLCARIIDYIRLTFLDLKISFTFETVMSHISKVEFLQEAKRKGYRTYLYYVSTVDPMINIARVKYRVQTGGHGVPEQKIIERYQRSMDLLMQAIEAADRTYIFDNSADGQIASFIAEIESAEILKMNQSLKVLPKWFAEKVLKDFEE
ncbi:zeta toxin family protein [Acinetobacter sp. ANC 3813]|uniref:zeta toxin family protein n=1 Tax=Acinetobacter sp. ANC 3813 TaxID=1977873 RepID=UPI000A32F79B|nr:zeta toxin family protein [Acinetobacter sp. ANC 3813]OTG91420.1 zeta toxin [Acinetobacter sp. ANC 3813]